MNNSLRNLYKKKMEKIKLEEKELNYQLVLQKVNKHDVSIIVQFD